MGKFLFLLLLTVFTPSKSFDPKPMAPMDGRTELASTSSPFLLPDLKNLIISKEINSIEDLLPQLPQDLRSNFTLVKKSASRIQEGSPTNPRVILFGSSGKLLLTFNGSAEQAGFNALEILAFDDVKKKYELQEVEFSPSNAPKWSSKNPSKCVACHTSNPKPIWDSYRAWPGVYGSDDDNFGETEDVLRSKKMPEMANTKELKEYRVFREFATNHPRYKSLAWEGQDLCYPYNCSVFKEKNLLRSPNFRLTFLASLNFAKSIAEEASKSFNYQAYKYTFLRLAICNPRTIKEVVQLSEILSSHASLSSQELFLDSKQAWKNEILDEIGLLTYLGIPYGSTSLALRIDEKSYGQSTRHARGAFTYTGLNSGLARLNGDDHHGLAYAQILRKVAEEDFSIQKVLLENSGWEKLLHSLGLETETGIYQAPTGFRQALNEDQALITKEGREELCRIILPKSDLEIARSPQKPIAHESNFFPTPVDGLKILKKSGCISCHQSPQMKTAVQIPFGNPKAFAEYIRQQESWGLDPLNKIEEVVSRPTLRTQLSKMPISGRGLTKEEIKILMDYLRSLTSAP